ncbi:MAG: helix-turn-helix domain-containing protein, partial [Planctomycetota bacterium]|nr:helix-turn-helix domain-containing protein [Planctomycetota bacterium]
MLMELMDGQARTATELALVGGVTPSTASIHLARLNAAGLLAIVKQGRHRYFHIAAPEVATAIESLMNIAPSSKPGLVRVGPRNKDLRRARVCYDHLAGEAAVRLLERLRERELIAGNDEALDLTGRGKTWCDHFGIDLTTFRTRRKLCRSCLDWSERRVHLSGALGAAILDRMFALRMARRNTDGRAIYLSSRGKAFVEDLKFSR